MNIFKSHGNIIFQVVKYILFIHFGFGARKMRLRDGVFAFF
jgi:hypothetical protein